MLNILFLGIDLFLAGLFMFSGIMKLKDKVGTKRSIIEFGVPSSISDYIFYVISTAEICFAIVLLINSYTWLGALGELVLLITFSIAVAVNIGLGKKPNCNCFGQVNSKPISWKTIIRNGILISLIIFILLQQQIENIVSYNIQWIIDYFSSNILMLSLVMILLSIAGIEGVIVSLLYKRIKVFYSRLSQLELKIDNFESLTKNNEKNNSTLRAKKLSLGMLAPNFILENIHGKTMTLTTILQDYGKPLLLIFSDPNCGSCSSLFPSISRWQKDYEKQITFIVISRGNIKANLEKANYYNLKNILLQQDREVSLLYGVSRTPSAIYIGLDGKIGSNLAVGADQITNLVKSLICPLSDIMQNVSQIKR